MDTEISYKYKDGFHPDIKSGKLTIDKSIYKRYTGRYGMNHEDDLKTSLSRRLTHCGLFSWGDVRCKAFMNNILEFYDEAFKSEIIDDDLTKMKDLFDWLLKQEMVEIKFECY